MNFYGDYHTHTRYSDGMGTVRQNIESAREKGLKQVAITDHGLNNVTMSLTWKKVLKEKEEIINLRKVYKDIDIIFGIESDIIGLDGTIDLTTEQIKYFDIILAGYHRWARAKSLRDFNKFYLNAYFYKLFKPSQETIKQNTNAYIKMIEKYPIAILAHINNYSIVNVYDVAKCCEDNNTIIELNSKHIDLSRDDFESILKTNVRLIADTDSHKSDRVGNFSLVEEFLKPYTKELYRIVNIGDTAPKFRKQGE